MNALLPLMLGIAIIVGGILVALMLQMRADVSKMRELLEYALQPQGATPAPAPAPAAAPAPQPAYAAPAPADPYGGSFDNSPAASVLHAQQAAQAANYTPSAPRRGGYQA